MSKHSTSKNKQNRANRKITALYCRSAVSDNEAIEKQKKLLAGYAKSKSIEKYEFYIDNSTSGSNPNRPTFIQMNSDINTGKISAVIVSTLHRLGRCMADVNSWIDGLRHKGIEVIAVDGSIDTAKDASLVRLAGAIMQKECDEEAYPACSACHRPMEPNQSCTISHIKINGKKHERKKAGDEVLYADADTTDDVTCPLCNVGMGQYHHWRCDVEECPVCNIIIDECGCNVEIDGSNPDKSTLRNKSANNMKAKQ